MKNRTEGIERFHSRKDYVHDFEHNDSEPVGTLQGFSTLVTPLDILNYVVAQKNLKHATDHEKKSGGNNIESQTTNRTSRKLDSCVQVQNS